MKIFSDISGAIGGTPLVALERFSAVHGARGRLLAKVEGANPGGSAKDRAARAMLDDARRRGLLAPGGLIVEPTSGNTGVALAMLAAVRGYRLVLTMPETMSAERRKLLAAYGAELVLTEGSLGMEGAIRAAERIAAETGAFMPMQFENPANAAAHRAETGPEIWRDTDGDVAAFVAGVGTGGTITGVGEYLKARRAETWVVAVEPAASPVLSGGPPGPHGIQGIGAGFVPGALNRAVVDEVVAVPDEAALETARALAKTEGILCGISSGAAAYAALALLKRSAFAGRTVVALLPDTGERYLSTALFTERENA